MQLLQKNFRSDSFVKTIVAGFATKVATFATDFSLINIILAMSVAFLIV